MAIDEKKITAINARRVTAEMVVTVIADHPAQVSKHGREIVDKAIGSDIDIAGFRLYSRDEICPTCKKIERKISGFKANKESPVRVGVTLVPEKNEQFVDFKTRLYKAVDKDDLVEIVDVKEGS